MDSNQPVAGTENRNLSGATRENFEYLVATLARRTAGKKYESFVINYLWSKLAHDALKPVTQQYVNRRSSYQGAGVLDFYGESSRAESVNHALIDLYFPQLHLGVECDEAQHHTAVILDASRTADIQRAIPDYLEIRIRVEKDEKGEAVAPSEVMQQLDDAVITIRQRWDEVANGGFRWARQGFLAWESETPDWALAKRAGALHSADGYVFRHNGEIRKLFSPDSDVRRKRNSYVASFDPSIPGFLVWCATLANQSSSGTYRSTNTSGILNVIVAEGNDVFIGEAAPTAASREARKQAEEAGVKPLPEWTYPQSMGDYPEFEPVSRWTGVKRLTFVRTKDSVGRSGYQFLGVFGPFMEFREINGILFKLCKLEHDQFELPRR
ncbi:AbaSI family restriction endonuclease [Mycetocola sp. JXN-3]|uniref:AbaSI family restriction endonuclease n=1 Tax=Mycetocola sp. JXN-3 TaxID=2116510 RepID=UPI00165D0466|nr:hypothetical protein [Mycetocola sp. JXN-3]